MQFSIASLLVFTLTILASAAPSVTTYKRQNERVQFVADLANQLNEDIAHTTQFFENFSMLNGLALNTQASAALTVFQHAISVVDSITHELSDTATAQVVKGELLDNDF